MTSLIAARVHGPAGPRKIESGRGGRHVEKVADARLARSTDVVRADLRASDPPDSSSLWTFLRRWASGVFLGLPHDALTYVQGNLGLKPWSTRYGWWRR